MAKKGKQETADFEAEGGYYGLNRGHATPFRRTVKYDEKRSAQLVFEPGVAYELSAIEVKCCQDLIDCGRLVPVTEDEKGRLRYPHVQPSMEASKEIESLKAKVAELSSANDKLSGELAALTKSGTDDKTPNTDGK